MAGRLALAGARTLAVVLALVLVGHVLSLSWLQTHMQSLGSLGGLQRMAKPMLTRQIAPQSPAPGNGAPAPEFKTKQAVAGVNRTKVAIKNIAKKTANTPAEASAAPEPGLAAGTSTAAPAATSSAASPTLAQTEPEPTTAVAAASATRGAAAPESLPSASAVRANTATTAAVSKPGADASTSDPLSRWPLDTRLSYELSGNFRGPLYGSGTVLWQRQGERYQASVDLDLGPKNMYHMLSQGRVTPDALLPLAFEEKRVSGKLRVVRLQEDAVTLDNGSRVPRPPDLQDAASQFVALTYQFTIGTRRLAVGEVLRYHLARPGGVDEWVFDVVAEDTLHTARWGPVKAFHLKPRPLANPRGNIYAEIWFAPSLQYLPARIRMTMGEVELDLLVGRIEQAQAAGSTLPGAAEPVKAAQ
jgi:hypothetical protein